MKDFDQEREEKRSGVDHTFRLDGHDFHFRTAVDQDMVDGYFDSLSDESSNAETVRKMDELVLACLYEDHHEAWSKARHSSENPIMGTYIHDVIGFMLGVMLGRPTERRTDSTGTPKDTGTSSTEKSPSQAEAA